MDHLQAVIDVLNGLGPYGILVGALLTVLAPKLVPYLGKLGPILGVVLKVFKPKGQPAPAPEPIPVPETAPAHPLLNAALSTLRMIALARFPWLTGDEALVRFTQELVQPIPDASNPADVSSPAFADQVAGPTH
jgi:hypothetical protein